MLRIVIDTNVLVACISRNSPHHWIWRAFLDGHFQLCLTTDILIEYAEVLGRFYSTVAAENTLYQFLIQNNVIQTIRYFEWRVMENDPDDNKFFDCAVAANADYIVTEDRHFKILTQISFPSIAVLNISEFSLIL